MESRETLDSLNDRSHAIGIFELYQIAIFKEQCGNQIAVALVDKIG
jgi:hypothetical protein